MKIDIEGTEGEVFELYAVIAVIAILAISFFTWLLFIANFNIKIVAIGAILGLVMYGLIKIGKKIIDRKQ